VSSYCATQIIKKMSLTTNTLFCLFYVGMNSIVWEKPTKIIMPSQRVGITGLFNIVFISPCVVLMRSMILHW